MVILKNIPEINYFIYGHLHLLEDFELTPTCRMVVLGEWIAAMSYGYGTVRNYGLKLTIAENSNHFTERKNT